MCTSSPSPQVATRTSPGSSSFFPTERLNSRPCRAATNVLRLPRLTDMTRPRTSSGASCLFVARKRLRAYVVAGLVLNHGKRGRLALYLEGVHGICVSAAVYIAHVRGQR